jgi:hypothetical protein
MTTPASPPVPKSILYIEGDPTGWGLRDVAPEFPDWDSTPTALAVIGPLAGTLVLSPVRAASFVLLPPPAGDGWAPAQKPAASFLYLPSAMGVPATSPGYTLGALNRDLPGLQADIMNAMLESTYLPVQVTGAGGTGVVVLNGGALPFVVLGAA